MNRSVAAVLALLTVTACSAAGPGPMVSIESGKEFSLKVGETALSPEGLRVGFDGVSGDSRCPKGEQCVWAGDVIVRVWLQAGDGPKAQGELHGNPTKGQAINLLNHELRLIRVDPQAITGKTIAPSSYVATLNLGRPGNAALSQ